MKNPITEITYEDIKAIAGGSKAYGISDNQAKIMLQMVILRDTGFTREQAAQVIQRRFPDQTTIEEVRELAQKIFQPIQVPAEST